MCIRDRGLCLQRFFVCAERTALSVDVLFSLLRRPDGLGLGLSIARRVASLHGGALVLEQREGRGLRSVVSLPVCPPERNQMLKTPQMGCDPTGGFSPVLVELSGVLPYQAFLPEDVE